MTYMKYISCEHPLKKYRIVDIGEVTKKQLSHGSLHCGCMCTNNLECVAFYYNKTGPWPSECYMMSYVGPTDAGSHEVMFKGKIL